MTLKNYVIGGLAGLALLLGCETASRRPETSYMPPMMGAAYADDTQAKPADSEKSDLEKSLDNIDVSKYDLKWVQEWKRKPVEEILKGLDYVHIDSTKEGWDEKYRREVFQEDSKPEERKPVFVLFYDPDNIKASEADRNVPTIYFRALNEVLGDAMKFIQIHLPVQTRAQQQLAVDIYAGRIEGVPTINGPPSFSIYSSKDGVVRCEDYRTNISISDQGVVNEISNAIDYWIFPLIFDKETPDSKRYKYNGGFKLVEVLVSRQ